MAIEQTENDRNQEQRLQSVEIDYKDTRCLLRFISERGKIIPSRISSQPIKRQREIARAIKKARILALLPFVVK
ncbi:MAG: 30S ribosomal protein S18 [Holosporales bacterium]|jgi:small subunit ribosomal protein S18|nr:30S ribosomal protein S18 [Holosporales bacterium]